MSNKLKILFIPKWYPSRVHEHNGNFIHRHALAVSMKHPVAVLFVSADPAMKDKMYETEYELENEISTVRVYYNNSLKNIPVVSSLIKFYRYLNACKIGIKVVNAKFGVPDISHIHVLARTFLPAYYYNYFYKTPVVISEQWSGYLPEDGMYKGFFKKMLTRIAIRKASAVTTVSQSLKNAMLSHGLKNNYSVIPNVVDTHLFYAASQNKKPAYAIASAAKKDKFIFLHVSNLYDRAKNISGMIKAMKKLSEKRDDFEFHIVGDGEERTELEKLAEKLQLLNKNIFFLKKKTSPEVSEMMRNADLFLLFSNYDNMPCVMVESLASGLPVVGTSIHGIKEHVKEGRGILVAPGDENAFCDAIVSAMNNIASYDKMKMSAYAKENFSYEMVSEQFDRVYQKVKA